MKLFRSMFIVIVILLTVSLQAWFEGNRCLGLWSDGYWYPATIVKAESGAYFPGRITAMSGDSIHVSYDDGDEEDTSIGMCRSMP